jgi:hypothetical protein
VQLENLTTEPADLVLLGMDASPPQLVAGDQVWISLNLDNLGASPADNVTVRLALPDTVQPVSADGGDDWSCTLDQDPDSAQRVWDCVTPRFEAEQLELVSPIQLVATVGAGTPDGTLTFTATVGTDSPEPTTDNNTLQATTSYQAQGLVSGRVWRDQDRDGQRDADEPPVANGSDGVRALRLMRAGLVDPAWDTPVADVGGDGTSTQPLAPGRDLVRVEVSPTLDSTTPNVGEEATDSDVVFTARADDGVTAQSAVVEAADGQHTVVDIGLVPTQP